jgi:hypothetical protein
VTTAGIYGAHRAYATATPLAVVPGFELGSELGWVSFPTAFSSSLSTLGVTSLTGLPIIKINFRKGLPAGFNLGGSFIYFSSFVLGGGDLSWSFLNGEGAKPAMALRASYGYTSLLFVYTHTIGADLLLSKNFKVFDPYIGAGFQTISGGIMGVQSLLATIPVSITTTATAVSGRVYGGFSLKLWILKMIFEGDYNFRGSWAAGGRFTLSF